MSVGLRVSIIVVSILFLFFVLKKIRKAQMQISDSLFWIVASIVFVIIGIWPWPVLWISHKLGVMSPANLVFLSIIFVLLLRLFQISCKLSKTENDLRSLAQQYAIEHKTECKDKDNK